MAGDSYFGIVKSLLHCDGANNGTTFTDSAISPRTWSAANGCVTSTAQNKFGTASLYYDGTSSRCIEAAYNAYFRFAGDFTVEGWHYPFDATNALRGIFTNGTSSGLYVRQATNNGGRYDLSVNGVIASSAGGDITINQFKHFAVVRIGSTIKLYIGGVEKASLTYSGVINDSAGSFQWGNVAGAGNQAFYGHLDELRITNDVGRYTGNFTPPTDVFDAFIGLDFADTAPSLTQNLAGDVPTALILEASAAGLKISDFFGLVTSIMNMTGPALAGAFVGYIGSAVDLSAVAYLGNSSFVAGRYDIEGVAPKATQSLYGNVGVVGEMVSRAPFMTAILAGDSTRLIELMVRTKSLRSELNGLSGNIGAINAVMRKLDEEIYGLTGVRGVLEAEMSSPSFNSEAYVQIQATIKARMKRAFIEAELRRNQ